MGNNSTIPEVGKGATVLHWTDRHAWEVVEVNEKTKMVVLERYAPKRVDNYGMSDDQHYEYKEFTGERMTLYYRFGCWKQKQQYYAWVDAMEADFGNHRKLHDAYKALGGQYNENRAMISHVEGMNRLKTEWHTVKIIFGTLREYYDYSF